jgi:hypothetical protein
MPWFLKRKNVKKFGQIAVEKGLATEKDIQEALKEQKEWAEKHKIHKEIGAILTEKRILTPGDVKTILEEQKSPISVMAWFAALFGMSR